MEVGQRLREQVRQLEHQREAEQLERARVVNALSQRLEETQKQCAKLLQTGALHALPTRSALCSVWRWSQILSTNAN